MLTKLLFKNQDRKQLIIAMIGSFLGITFLITSIHYLIKVNEFGEGTEILGPNTIIVQKKVTTSTTFGMSKSDFSQKEIDNLLAMPFITYVKPILTNNFNLWFETSDKRIPEFKTNLFIQTVDESFLKIDSKKWQWEKGDKSVPIILPRDFIVMLNTFAASSGFAQVSDELAMKAGFKFMISDEYNNKEWFDVHIVGFTSEVSAVLVPASFMEYGNMNFRLEDEKKITQIMISGKESEFGLVEQMLTENGLETRESQMIVGRLKSMVGTLFFVVLCISIIAVFLSGLVLIQYMQLLMSKNAYEVRTLLRIGYHPDNVIRQFFIYFVKVFGVVMGMGMVTFLFFKHFLDKMFKEGGLHIDTGITYWSMGALLLALALFTLSSFLTAKKGIYKEY
tara:strand:- start:11589 stop:12767 length:1179 start_codon:yes stop_codon:yes gene_type:complete